MPDINLNFAGPFTFTEGSRCVFHAPVSASPGVYLWAIKQHGCDEYLLHYVGETTHLANRHWEHLIHILGLNYGIWDVGKAQRGVSHRVWDGLWRERRKPEANLPASVIEAYTSKHEAVLQYLSVLDIFFAELHVERDLRKHIEGCIGWHFRNNHPQHKDLYPDDNHVGTKKTKDIGILRISAPAVIRGLDSEIPY